MNITIDFNHQSVFSTIKINDESTDWVLPAEFVSTQVTVPEDVPEIVFGWGERLAQLLGALANYW
jgi:hypothetical protein